jgi:hypothetical protein
VQRGPCKLRYRSIRVEQPQPQLQPQPEPTTRSEADPVDAELRAAMERARQQTRTRVAGAVVLVFVAWNIWLQAEWADRAAGLGVARSYLMGYVMGGILLALIVGGIACAFPKRSWFRFFVAVSIVCGLVLPSQLKQLGTFTKERLREGHLPGKSSVPSEP